MTLESSDQVAPTPTALTHPYLGQGGANQPEIMKDKHFLTLVKMIETILALSSAKQQDTGT